jgi:hypothetical protein
MANRCRLKLAAGLAMVFATTTNTSLTRADTFVAGCTVPFASTATHPSIDGQCGNEGGAFSATDPDTPPHRAQNRAKNNLCANGTPSRITTLTMKNLQTATNQLKAAHKLKFGARDMLPDDRSVLQNLVTTSDGNTVGEGSLVLFVGFIQKTKAGSTETVNCGLSGIDNNDIHIVLGRSKQGAECSSITAETIPHLRPASWNRTKLDQVHKPVRITGQLFFDASHLPCSGGVQAGATHHGARIGKYIPSMRSRSARMHR